MANTSPIWGYNAVASLEGISNSETTNSAAQITGATGPFYDRAVALVTAKGPSLSRPENFAYSGDSPRAVITVDGTQFYMGLGPGLPRRSIRAAVLTAPLQPICADHNQRTNFACAEAPEYGIEELWASSSGTPLCSAPGTIGNTFVPRVQHASCRPLNGSPVALASTDQIFL